MESAHTQDAVPRADSTLDIDWDRLERAFQKISLGHHKRPDGAFTAAEYAEREQLERSWATKKLKRLVKEGLLDSTPPKPGVTTYYYFKET